jgi:uncharacterized membrane protein YeaQ/YmgE (transglycosylase-associated protein family)
LGEVQEQCFRIGCRAADSAESPGVKSQVYRNDLSISLRSGNIRSDLPKSRIPAEGRTLEEKGMFHVLWYLIIGLLAGLISKSVMHVHITLLWTLALGVIGSVLGGGVTHMILRPKNERYHPAGLIFSTLGAILVLFICHKLKIHFPSF